MIGTDPVEQHDDEAHEPWRDVVLDDETIDKLRTLLFGEDAA